MVRSSVGTLKSWEGQRFFSAFALVFRYTFEPSTPESLNAVGEGDPGEGQGT